MALTSVKKFFLLFVVGFFSSTTAQSETIALIPNWSDPVAEKYLKSNFAQSPLEIGQSAYTLPVLGFVQGFDQAELAPDLEGRFIAGADRSFKWPACATEMAAARPVRDKSGTWYTRDYDFGCLHVSINGDLSSENSTSVSTKPDGASVAASGDGVLTLSVTRFGIPYMVDIECYDEAKTLCNPTGPWQSLLDRLSILEGQPL